ncbi:MAG: class I SAM-dependent methyltransferase [Sphingobacteriales bacterium JAD_PAG50586_3]|nr:MAG: class I SAM-dependent methyltransferase [Sphingobacteriales bacterium JAD_PAG50586_3]
MQLDEETLKHIAAQLRKPDGEAGKQTGERMNQGNQVMNLATIAQLHITADDNLLEIGMGNGYFVPQIVGVNATVKYTGLDYSETMVEEACMYNKQHIADGQAQFVLSSVGTMPFEDHLFTKAFTVNTLYFWEDPAQVLAELRRVLKPGGELFITIRPKEVMLSYPFTQYGFTMYTADEVSQLLTNNGFTVSDIVKVDEPDIVIEDETIEKHSLIICAKAL